MILEKYIYNSPEIVHAFENESYTYFFYSKKSYNQEKNYLKYMFDDKVVIKKGRIYCEGVSDQIKVSIFLIKIYFLDSGILY